MNASRTISIGIIGDTRGVETWAKALAGSGAAPQRSPAAFDDLGALVIAEGTQDPFARAKEALLAGCHVLYAAPFAFSPWQANVLLQLSGREGRILRFMEPFRYRAGFAFLQRLTAGTSSLWRPLYVRMLSLSHPRAATRIDCLATEQLAICDALLEGTPTRMTAGAVRADETGDVCAAFLTLNYGDGTLVQMTVSLAEAVDARQLVAVTPERTIVLDDLDPVAAVRVLGERCEHDYAMTGPASNEQGKIVVSESADPVGVEAEAFARAIATGDLTAGNGRRWTRVAALWWAARQSMTFGEPAEVPLPGGLSDLAPPALRVIEGGGHPAPAPHARPPLTVVAN